jgi:superfamily II DNA or RNA helicase
MKKDNYLLRQFQQYTVDAAYHHLFEDKESSVKRFLVADEVGLGKTIIARHVIDRLQKSKKKKVKVVYITSSLDIAKQNKGKLAGSDANAPQDRITLIYSKKLKDKGVVLFSMTPDTSLSDEGLGNKEERLYLAWLLKKIFGLRGIGLHPVHWRVNPPVLV